MSIDEKALADAYEQIVVNLVAMAGKSPDVATKVANALRDVMYMAVEELAATQRAAVDSVLGALVTSSVGKVDARRATRVVKYAPAAESKASKPAVTAAKKERAPRTGGPSEEDLLQIIQKMPHGPFTVKVLRKEKPLLGVNPPIVYARIKALLEDGHLKYAGGKGPATRYELASKSKKAPPPPQGRFVEAEEEESEENQAESSGDDIE